MGMPATAAGPRNHEFEPPDESRLIEDVSALISPPRVCAKLYELVHSARASADDIGEVVALDPNLTGRVLRIVNSSFYGFPSQIETIARAVTILGVRDLYNLVLAISAVRSFAKVTAGLVRMELFWQHSVFCALLARLLAKHYRLPDPDRLFVTGLLHEVGVCIIYSQIPQLDELLRPALDFGEAALHDAELDYLGYSHASVGALVLEQWQLPAPLRDAVRHHHQPDKADDGRVEAALLNLADALAAQTDRGALSGQAAEATDVNPAVWEILGAPLGTDDEQQILSQANDQFSSTMQNLLPR
jgi:putative nucleotidyltransferase with HDIG domain